MKNIYDNGDLMLGQVSEINKHNDNLLEERNIDIEVYLELKKELDCYDPEDIIAIDYCNGMGLYIRKWDKKDIVKECD